MGIYKKKLVPCCLFIGVCFVFISCGYACSDASPIDGVWQSYCTFNGILKNETRWNEEFKMLEESHDYPNYEKMRDKLSIFMAIPNSYIDKCPSLKKYLLGLIKYHAGNENIAKDVKEILNYISQNKLGINEVK